MDGWMAGRVPPTHAVLVTVGCCLVSASRNKLKRKRKYSSVYGAVSLFSERVLLNKRVYLRS